MSWRRASGAALAVLGALVVIVATQESPSIPQPPAAQAAPVSSTD